MARENVPTSRDMAQQLSATVDKQQQKTADGRKHIRVVATKKGYDGKRIRKEGERFLVLEPESGKKLPSWQQREDEFDAEAAVNARKAELEDAGIEE